MFIIPFGFFTHLFLSQLNINLISVCFFFYIHQPNYGDTIKFNTANGHTKYLNITSKNENTLNLFTGLHVITFQFYDESFFFI